MKYCPVCDQRMTRMSSDVWVCKQACVPPPPPPKPAPKKRAPRKKRAKSDE